jgi:hypothetical protein
MKNLGLSGMSRKPPKSPEGGLYCRANERPAPFCKMVLDHFRESGEQKKNRFLQLRQIEKAILTEILVLIDTTKRSFWKCRLDNKRYNTPRLCPGIKYRLYVAFQ